MVLHIKKPLESIINTRGDWRTKLFQNWPKIMDQLASKVRIEKVEKHTLILGVYESSWMQELYLLSETLIEKINQHLEHPHIKQLRFKAAAHQKKKWSSQRTKKEVKQPRAIALNTKETAALEKINDNQLRSALKQFFIKCHQER